MKAERGHDKAMGLGEAIEAYVKRGSHVSIGGFTVSRNPMAAVYEIIRLNPKSRFKAQNPSS